MLLILAMAMFPRSSSPLCKTEFQITVKRAGLGDILVPIDNRLKKSMRIYLPIYCNTKGLIQQNNFVEFIEILDSSVTPKFRRGLISGKTFRPQSTGYYPGVIHGFFNLVEEKYEKSISQLCGSQKYCDDIIVKNGDTII